MTDAINQHFLFSLSRLKIRVRTLFVTYFRIALFFHRIARFVFVNWFWLSWPVFWRFLETVGSLPLPSLPPTFYLFPFSFPRLASIPASFWCSFDGKLSFIRVSNANLSIQLRNSAKHKKISFTLNVDCERSPVWSHRNCSASKSEWVYSRAPFFILVDAKTNLNTCSAKYFDRFIKSFIAVRIC